MIKVSNEYLDFDDVVEMEKQIKLLEDISTTDGDFSYAFELQKTLNNTRLLRNPFPDNRAKLVYQRIPAQILAESGAVTYDGYIRIERITHVYKCSFFSGNNNWFGMIDGQLQDEDFSIFDIDQNEVNIIDSWSLTEGLVFPLLDNGGLITRSWAQLKIEDFVAGIYVKTILRKIFTSAGIKIKGELLEDWRYQHLICVANSKNDDLLNAATSYVEKNTPQVIPFNTTVKVTWDNDSMLPYFDGSDNAFTNDEYVAPLKMSVRVNFTDVYLGTGFGGLVLVAIRVNGVNVRTRAFGALEDTETTCSLDVILNLNPGDIITVHQNQTNSDGDAGQILRGTIKITPTYIYRTIASSAVPNWTKQQFVSNVLRIFNVLPYYDAGTATLTLNLFEKITSKPSIDLSPYISDTEIDYQDFISDYGQSSLFSYAEVEYEQLKTYNKGKFLKYGQGSIPVNNGFLENEKEILKSDFANPIAYNNPVFDASLELTNLIELEEGEEIQFPDVADDGFGDAAFQDPNGIFLPGDLARIVDSTNEVYNGEWVVKSIPSGHVVFNGLPFDTAASGTIKKLNYKYSNNEDVFLFLNIPNYQVSKFSDASIVFDSGGFYPIQVNNVALAYFDLINTGKQINNDFIYSLSFGNLEDPLRYQLGMIEGYFRLFSAVLQDPVKLISTCTVPYDVYNRINFLQPIKILTEETQNQYYLNRISGYKESFMDSEWQLIKLPGGDFPIEAGTPGNPGSSIIGGDLPDIPEPEPETGGLPYSLPFSLG